ncbi:MAG: G-D-S-L family lipolytic protein, partial [Bacteroidales bacterium]|nr:G-D-S-L family lipolytic protein [Bacteroidales bacterium]
MKHIKYILPLLAVIVFACEPEMEEFKPEAGQADFSRYVAVGNSITAGYADGALYRQGQLFSYPNLIAEQLKQVGGGTFKQPLMYDDLGMRNYMILNVAVPVDEKLVLAYNIDC